MSKTNITLEAKLKELTHQKGERDRFVREVAERQKAEREEALESYDRRLSTLANECRKDGGTHRRIQGILCLQNWSSYQNLLNKTLGEMSRQDAEMANIVDLEPFEITFEEPSPWNTVYYEFIHKATGTKGSVRANSSGRYLIEWHGDVNNSPRREIKEWYHAKTGFGSKDFG